MDFNTNYNKVISSFYLTKIVLLLFTLFTIKVSSQSGTVTPVDGSSEEDVGFNLYYDYSYSQTIYTQAQINNTGPIESIQFEYDGYGSGYTINITI